MADKMTVKISGLRELGLAMKELDSRLQKRIGRGATNAAGRVVAKAIKERVPLLKVPNPRRTRGTIRRSIRVKAERVRDGQFESRVWVKGVGRGGVAAYKKQSGKNAATNPNDPYYWWWVEFGTAKMAAQPFMRRGFAGSAAASVDAMKTYLADRLEREGAQIGRTIGKA